MRIAVLCEPGQNNSLLAQARRMAPGAQLLALCEDTVDITATGADEVILLGPAADDCARGSQLAAVLRQEDPDIALFPATVRGRFLSAWTAAKLGVGLTADCTGLQIDGNGQLLQIRPAFGGGLTAEILTRTRPQLASVRPGVFAPAETAAPVPLTRKAAALAPAGLTELVESLPAAGGALSGARVIVAGGKGIGSREGFALLEELAALLGGAVAASRAAVDAGYAPYDRQVGQTGVTVRPKLYLAFGISGMIQHRVGMSGAEVVAAVNTDPRAPIFQYADYGVTADWRETAQIMIRRIGERKRT